MLEKASWWEVTARNRLSKKIRFKISADESYSEERILEIFKEVSELEIVEMEKIPFPGLTFVRG